MTDPAGGSVARLHPDFGDVRVSPGAADVRRTPDRFEVTNIITLGGAEDVHPHVPTKVGQVGSAVFWESTGAADALPFWNTNFRGDVLLYLISGSVRVEFKALEGSEPYATYIGRTGDLMRLPKDIAHRTFSGDGKRRISLEIIEHDERWDDLGWVGAVEPATSLELDGLSFTPGAETTTVRLAGASSTTSSSFLLRGARALVAYGLHLGHNEFEGGFIVQDALDGQVSWKLGGTERPVDRRAAVGLLKGLIVALAPLVDGEDGHR